ncbi:Uncharacterised protein [Klebsiella pneumoniae]|nr:Uncharacterised protein [Klebsiella pneumoniae]
MGGLQLVAGVGHFGHQAPHPGVQLQLQQTPVLGGADIFALDHLQVVRDARQQEDVRQTRVDAAVGGGVGGIVQRRFLRGVGREEAGVIAIFVVRQRDKAQAGELKLPRLRDHHLGRDLHLVAGAQIVQMDRQIFHRAARLRTANLHAPAVVNKALHHIRCEGERRAGPEIFFVIRALHLLDIVEAAHRHGVRTVRQTTQHARHHQTDVAGIVSFAKRLPADIFRTIEVVADILNGSHLFHGLFQEEGRADGADKRHMGGRRDAGDIAQQRHILRAGVELIGRDHRADRLAAGSVILRGIGVPVQAALDKLRRVLKVLAQIVFGDVEDLRFDVLPIVGVVHQLFEAAPQGFDLLKLLMVHHRVQLTAYLEIQLGDMVVDQRFVELFHPLAGLTDAFHKHLHRRGETLRRRRLGERGIVQKVVDIPEARRRGEINFFKQRGVNALARPVFLQRGLPLNRGVFCGNRH